MYATRLMTEIYHLVQPGGQHTLCGLRVSRVTSERKANTLQRVNEVPQDLTICKHCDRIRNQDVRDWSAPGKKLSTQQVRNKKESHPQIT